MVRMLLQKWVGVWRRRTPHEHLHISENVLGSGESPHHSDAYAALMEQPVTEYAFRLALTLTAPVRSLSTSVGLIEWLSAFSVGQWNLVMSSSGQLL